MALVDGQWVGGMTRSLTDTTVTFRLDPFRALTEDELAALDGASQRYGAFLERESVLFSA